MAFETIPDQLLTETEGQWRHETLGWKSQMEVSPVAMEEDYTFAVGVDGREVGELRSDLGHLLLEDLCRTHPVFFDGTTTGTTNYRDAAHTQILQAEPFAISAHAVDGTRKYGFVCRWRGTGNFGQTDQAAYTPLLALWVYDDAVIDSALTDTGKLRLILPRSPSRDILGATDANGHANDSRLRHYNDKGYYDGGGGGYPDRGRLIACNSDIVVSYNDRFIFVFSTTNEFTPIVMWYNSDDAGATPRHFSSAQNPGWHWEPMGPNDPGEPAAAQITVSTNNSAGYAYGGNPPAYYYRQRHRFWDYFRNRHTSLYKDRYLAGGHLTDLKSINYILTRYSTVAADSRDVEAAMFYRHIELFSQLGTQRESIKGTPYSMYIGPTMMKKTVSSLVGVLDWILDYGATTSTWKFVGFMNTEGQEQDIAGGETLQSMSDEGLAQLGLPIDTADMVVYDPPQSYVLGATHLQGVHFVATSVITGVSGSKFSTTTTNSSNVVVQWSDPTSVAPEMFNPVNSYITRLDARKPFALVTCGDFVLAVGSGPVVRFRLNGSFVEVVELTKGLELVSNKAAVEVRGSLLAVTKSGVFEVEPASGTVTPLGAVNRLMRDFWGATASAVKCVFDETMDVVYLVNTTNKTAIKLWIEKQRLTQLEDFPYTFLCQQIINGSKRAVFITEQGRFVFPARYMGESSYGTVTMAGVLGRTSAFLNKRFNFRVYSITGGGSFSFVLEDSEDTFFEEYATTHNKALANQYWGGFNLYLLTGSSRGRKIPIVTVDDGTSTRGIITTDHDPSSYLAVGDYVSFTPVIFGAVGPPLDSGTRGVSGTQLREVYAANAVLPLLITNGHAWAAKAGNTEYAPAALYPVFEMGVVDNDGLLRTEPQTSTVWFDRYYNTTAQERSCTVPDIAKGYAYSSDNPATMFGYLRGTGHILYPYFKSWISNCVFRLKEWSVRGRIVPSEITVGS